MCKGVTVRMQMKNKMYCIYVLSKCEHINMYKCMYINANEEQI